MNRSHWAARIVIGMVTLLLVMFAAASGPAEAAGPKKKFTLVNVAFDGTKIWLPGSLVVNEGDDVELTLINTLDVPHGFKIDVFGIESVIAAKSKSTITFTAKMPGVHAYICQLHPAHVGGQVHVIAK